MSITNLRVSLRSLGGDILLMHVLDEGDIGIAFHRKRLLISKKVPNLRIEEQGFPFKAWICVKERLKRAFAYQQLGDLVFR